MANLRANKIVSTTGSNAITGSVEFDGTGDYLGLASSVEFTQTGDFTMECWFYSTSTSGVNVIIDGRGGSSSKLGPVLYTNGTNLVFDNGAGAVVTATGVITANSGWNHIVGTRSGNTWTLYLNGISQGSATDTSTYSSNTGIWIGSSWNNEYFDGFISNVRVVKGTALYTQNFIPPTRELRNIPGAVLLCCQNPNSATQEATGKTITVNGNATARNFAPAVGSDGTVTFDGVTKISTENYFYLPTGPTEQREPVFPGGNVGGNARGLFGGGYSPTFLNTINYITIQSTGDAIYFGDLTTARIGPGACASSIRGIWSGGRTPTALNTIDYVTISSTGNAQDFGDISSTYYDFAGLSNSVRGVFAGNTVPGSTYGNIIEFITIASTGNSQDFGDLTAAKSICGSCASPTRGIFAGGNPAPSTAINTIEFIQIQTQGIAQDFGDLTTPRLALSGCSSTTRGIFAAGYNAPANTNVIDYITIATQSNALDFGDLSYSASYIFSCSSSTRGVFAGGNSPTKVNTIEYVTIASISYSTDFGDLTGVRAYGSALSNGHGGLG